MSILKEETAPLANKAKMLIRRKVKAFTVVQNEDPQPQSVLLQLDAILHDDGTPINGALTKSRGTCPSCKCPFGRRDFSEVLAHINVCSKKRKQKNVKFQRDFIVSDKKDAYFKSQSVSLKYPLVRRERLESHVELDDESDRKLVINILMKNSVSRIKEEITFLQMAFKNIKFFLDTKNLLDEKCFNQLFKSLHIERFSAGKRIFSYGDLGTKFYIIIEGSIFVLLKNAGIIQNEEVKGENATEPTERLSAVLKPEMTPEEKKKEVETCYPGFWIVRTMNQGDAFGEIALQRTGNRMRTATIVCQEDTLVGTLTYDDYQLTLAKLFETQQNDKLEFFKKIDAFNHWTRNNISALICHVEEVKLQRKRIILKQGEISNAVYFIKSGEIELQKAVKLPQDEVAEILSTLEDQDKPLRSQTIRPKKPELLKLGKIGPGDYLGLSATLEKTPTEFTAIVSSEEVTLIKLSREKFMKFVRDNQTLDLFKKHISRRNQWHEEMTSKFININVHHRQLSKKISEVNPFTENVEPRPPSSNKRIETPKKPTLIKSSHVLKTMPISPKSKIPITSPKIKSISSLTVQTTQEFLNSKKFFATSTTNTSSAGKNLKFGVAYQRHQDKLKKLFEADKEENNEKAGKRVRSRLNTAYEPISAFISTHQSKETSILMKRPPQSAKPNTRLNLASTTLVRVGASEILNRRLSTDENDRTDIGSPFPSTPGLKISSLAVPSHYSLRTEAGPRSYYLGSIDANFSLSLIKKIPSTSIFAQDRSDRDNRDSLQEIIKNKTTTKTKHERGKSYVDFESPKTDVSIPLYTSISAFQNKRR